jgi:hypothetical protein
MPFGFAGKELEVDLTDSIVINSCEQNTSTMSSDTND